ncbi:MAG TPA: SMP-30/gluconolactonase/LRE family protein [Acidimicrobiales bacterium]|jgi:sugar lactone lactonase YvrE|nr:SMP-30/gluconolactonase/LRE family protein [Acidimicrobiales bacterium]
MEVIVRGGSFFEAPRWHEGRWWVSDFFRRRVYSYDADGGDERREAQVAGQPSGLGWDAAGALMVVSMLDQRLLRRDPDTGTIETLADLAPMCGGPANDMTVDRAGRAWVGNFGFDLWGGGDQAPTSLARVDPDGTVTEVAAGLMFPNGAVITDDGLTLIVGETFAGRYTAFSIGPDGALGDRRTWADLPGVHPDGCTLDADGRIWTADAGGERCLLVEEGGRIVRQIDTPGGLGVYACMLGGEQGTTLLMCCCPVGRADETPFRREAVLVTVEVDAPHAGLP